LRKFYQDFASKLVIFDPLDRPVPTNNNQAISREDLVQTIGSMKSISGGDVYAPFSSKHLNLFDDMIGKEYEHCNKVVDRCIEEAEEQGEHYDFNLLNERAFEALERSLRYFAEKNLLLDGEKRLIKFSITLPTRARSSHKPRCSGSWRIKARRSSRPCRMSMPPRIRRNTQIWSEL